MRYRLSEADALFVEEVQRFLKDNLDPHLARKVKYGEPVAKLSLIHISEPTRPY